MCGLDTLLRKKSIGKAVDRNFAKRRMREMMRLSLYKSF